MIVLVCWDHSIFVCIVTLSKSSFKGISSPGWHQISVIIDIDHTALVTLFSVINTIVRVSSYHIVIWPFKYYSLLRNIVNLFFVIAKWNNCNYQPVVFIIYYILMVRMHIFWKDVVVNSQVSATLWVMTKCCYGLKWEWLSKTSDCKSSVNFLESPSRHDCILNSLFQWTEQWKRGKSKRKKRKKRICSFVFAVKEYPLYTVSF